MGNEDKDNIDLVARIGQRMQEARKKANSNKGYTQREVADLLNVSPITLSRWETGTRKPSFEKLEEFAKLVHQPLAYFFEESPIESYENVALKRITKKLGEKEDEEALKKIIDYATLVYKSVYNDLDSDEG